MMKNLGTQVFLLPVVDFIVPAFGGTVPGLTLQCGVNKIVSLLCASLTPWNGRSLKMTVVNSD